MKKILKYPLSGLIDDILLPAGAQVLSAITQQGTIMVYALVDDESTVEVLLRFVIQGTGWQFEDTENLTFLNTVVNGSLVWHVFYMKE